ncbi:protein-glutamate O-methyltransferase CheR [Bacillus sp. MRMR6]|uniref:CheR family methyltransferase n=1 Tax=Bacillus sp. MRMR6 TaxID=1928617 RepID=UPI00095170C8|nr:protein-glutamate O-methyltransferase CheR [Bacillus sp. MRMR6]OLS33531.1 chemotaxis protein CheR [Bacillus sp. MRMR6]
MQNDYEKFIKLFEKKTGISLSSYGEKQMKRRLDTYREAKGLESFAALFCELEKNHTSFEEFLNRMTINTTEFFRNKRQWEYLDQEIIPGLLKEKGTIKVWSAACSSGEEPYSVAMMLAKHIPLSQMSIFGTDIDHSILFKAQQGVYHERSLKEVPEGIKRKYFTKEGSTYVISDVIKETVLFKHQNLLVDDFESDFDLIICRNVLIYFTEVVREALYHRFHRSLKSGGILFAGSTEPIFTPHKYGFEAVNPFFYKKVEIESLR